ncbi:ABC transporter permease [Bacillus sp. P14.5]|uniref:ABC transporter permease n=1 Tax=Bacillus sp. P14.5 TaxID=1983400 RepID=UPI000DE83A71|nr:ABC transporter permease [Bacillus sp. P14.5]
MIASLMKRGKAVNSFRLFSRRYRDGFQFQYKAFKSVADWTVMLYLIIPSLVIGTMIYRSWWIDIPDWVEQVPFELFYLIPFLYILTGYFRTCLLEADQVFLVKHQRLFLGVKKWGIFSTYAGTFLLTFAVGGLLAPFWLNHYSISVFAFVVYMVFLLSSKWSHMAVKGALAGKKKSWKRTGLFLLAIVVQLQLWGIAYRLMAAGLDVILLLVNIGLIFFSLVLNRKRIFSENSMKRNLHIEGNLKMKWISLILLFSQHVEKQPVSSERSKPLLFPKSQRIFKRQTPTFGYLELFTKVLIRNFTYSATYTQSIGVLSFSQIVLPALWLKLGAAALVALSIFAWNEWIWEKLVTKHPIGSKYSEKAEFIKVQSITRALAFIPYFAILAISMLHYFGVF